MLRFHFFVYIASCERHECSVERKTKPSSDLKNNYLIVKTDNNIERSSHAGRRYGKFSEESLTFFFGKWERIISMNVKI